MSYLICKDKCIGFFFLAYWLHTDFTVGIDNLVLRTEIEQEVSINLQLVGVRYSINRRHNHVLTRMHRINLVVLTSSWLCVPHGVQNKSVEYMDHDADLHPTGVFVVWLLLLVFSLIARSALGRHWM